MVTGSLDELVSAIARQGDRVAGLSEEELREVALDHGVTSLPGRYAEFLTLMGRRAGRLLVGTDIFYPRIIGLRASAHELLEDEGVSHLVGDDAIVFAMHQGYQIYWMTDASLSDPPVCMYQEGDQEVRKTWPTFSAFLTSEARRVDLHWGE